MHPTDQKNAALKALARIADAFDANDLDDEARKFWGKDLEFANDRLAEEIVLYSGRGGKTLLTLKDCLDARVALALPDPQPDAQLREALGLMLDEMVWTRRARGTDLLNCAWCDCDVSGQQPHSSECPVGKADAIYAAALAATAATSEGLRKIGPIDVSGDPDEKVVNAMLDHAKEQRAKLMDALKATPATPPLSQVVTDANGFLEWMQKNWPQYVDKFRPLKSAAELEGRA